MFLRATRAQFLTHEKRACCVEAVFDSRYPCLGFNSIDAHLWQSQVSEHGVADMLCLESSIEFPIVSTRNLTRTSTEHLGNYAVPDDM